jgi:hypothetical protein
MINWKAFFLLHTKIYNPQERRSSSCANLHIRECGENLHSTFAEIAQRNMARSFCWQLDYTTIQVDATIYQDKAHSSCYPSTTRKFQVSPLSQKPILLASKQKHGYKCYFLAIFCIKTYNYHERMRYAKRAY